MTSRSALTVAVALGASLFLAACTGTEDTSAPETITPSADQDGGATTTTDAPGAAETTSPGDDDSSQPGGDDPVFATIDAVLAEYPDGIIVDIDREDRSDAYDIDIVVGNEVIELEVNSEGTIHEVERDSDDDDVREAQAATVTAAEAIQEARELHPDGFLDEAQLDEDFGRLEWEIELDDADHRDLVELTLPAN